MRPVRDWAKERPDGPSFVTLFNRRELLPKPRVFAPPLIVLPLLPILLLMTVNLMLQEWQSVQESNNYRQMINGQTLDSDNF